MYQFSTGVAGVTSEEVDIREQHWEWNCVCVGGLAEAAVIE